MIAMDKGKISDSVFDSRMHGVISEGDQAVLSWKQTTYVRFFCVLLAMRFH